MKKLFLHIGRQKTGTTSIQKTLYQNRDKLIESGFYYPETGIRVTAHHDIAEALGGKNLSTNEELRAKLSLTLKNETQETSCNNIIISSEAFQGCNPSEVFRFFENFEVIPVCYLREQAAFLRSSYLQKVHATDYSAPIETFYRDSFSADYRAFLEKWTAVFKKDFFIRLFDKNSLTDGNVVRDFLFVVLGLSRENVERLEIFNDENPSLSHDMLSFKLEYNARGIPNNGRIYLGLGKLSKGTGSKYEIPLAITQEIRAQHADSNRWVEENLFTDGQKFSYPLFEGETLDTISTEGFYAILKELHIMRKNEQKERKEMRKKEREKEKMERIEKRKKERMENKNNKPRLLKRAIRALRRLTRPS